MTATSPRAALLAFADELAGFEHGLPVDVIAYMARERAADLPDDIQLAELAGGPTLDVDQKLRVEALQAAAHWHIGEAFDDDRPRCTRVVDTARVFEAYLREER